MCVFLHGGHISPTDISRSGTYIEEATMEMCLWMLYVVSGSYFFCHLPSCLPLIKWSFCIGPITMTSGLENRVSLSQTETWIKSNDFLFWLFFFLSYFISLLKEFIDKKLVKLLCTLLCSPVHQFQKALGLVCGRNLEIVKKQAQ